MVTFSRDRWVWAVSIPVELDRHTLENNDEDVKHVKDSDDSK